MNLKLLLLSAEFTLKCIKLSIHRQIGGLMVLKQTLLAHRCYCYQYSWNYNWSQTLCITEHFHLHEGHLFLGGPGKNWAEPVRGGTELDLSTVICRIQGVGLSVCLCVCVCVRTHITNTDLTTMKVCFFALECRCKGTCACFCRF